MYAFKYRLKYAKSDSLIEASEDKNEIIKIFRKIIAMEILHFQSRNNYFFTNVISKQRLIGAYFEVKWKF